jgi:uroporphyrinogen-III synthase
MTNRPIILVSVTPSDDPDVTHMPLLATKWLEPRLDLSRFDGIIFTSKNGIDALERIDPSWKKLPVLCVGKATRQKADALGATILDTADGYGDGVGELLRTRYRDKKWLYARPKVVASDFVRKARDSGIAVEEAVVYETVCRAEAVDDAIDANAVLIFTSPSAVQCYLTRFALHGTQTIVVIGRTTERTLQGHDVHVAAEPTVAACIALAKQLAKEPL